ncbi:hypothetical protein EVAR_17594_1 [Eumeta japonica]|uniref:Uncharacterized protein n=1 Tax=Eumeta variegata TaxID=151549 RepID=A0A4C1UBW0_EUMVA|nr:hypothetical protein EVAR_17594_1 [Eumeta japonica]
MSGAHVKMSARHSLDCRLAADARASSPTLRPETVSIPNYLKIDGSKNSLDAERAPAPAVATPHLGRGHRPALSAALIVRRIKNS